MSDNRSLLERSLHEIKRLKGDVDTLKKQKCEPIAIVGTACRYPGEVNSLEALFESLSEGKNGIRELANERWEMEKYYSDNPQRAGKIYTKAMGFLDGIDLFDADLFGMNKDELIHVDPQQRLLLESAWNVFEDAGYSPASISGSNTGVYIGIMSDDYSQVQGELSKANYYIGTGTARSCAAGRISFSFGLEGPTLSVDSACSSSLATVHLAVQALRRKECDMAVAGGVNLILSPHGSVVACRSSMLSKEGRCATFDEEADGYVRSEGCGLVLLKTLSAAERDSDQIYAVIRGSALNHDGRSQGFTAPSGKAQRKVMQAALEDAQIDPTQVQYLECHGTGTKLGDPVELRAIDSVYVQPHSGRSPIVVGALKSNIGHMESAAGIGALHKVVSVLKNGKVPANLHFNKLNSQIRINLDKIKIAKAEMSLDTSKETFAAVSSFGFSGTNAHVVLQRYESTKEENYAEANERTYAVKVSAKNGQALKEYIESIRDSLDRGVLDIRDVSKTLLLGRRDETQRLCLTANSIDSLKAGFEDVIQDFDTGKAPNAMPLIWVLSSSVNKPFVNSLYRDHDEFRSVIKKIFEIIEGDNERSIHAYEKYLTSDVSLSAYKQISIYALAKYLKTLGVQPQAIMGYRACEHTAAAIAGVITEKEWLAGVFDKTLENPIQDKNTHIKFLSSKKFTSASDISAKSISKDLLSLDFLEEEGANILCFEREMKLLSLRQASEKTLDSFDTVLADLYQAGSNINWSIYCNSFEGKRISLPSYPFQRQAYWTPYPFMFDKGSLSTVGMSEKEIKDKSQVSHHHQINAFDSVDHPLIHSVFKAPNGTWSFFGEIDTNDAWYVLDHKVSGQVVIPASVYVDVMNKICAVCWPEKNWCFDTFNLMQRCVMSSASLSFFCQLQKEGKDLINLTMYSRKSDNDAWVCHAQSNVHLEKNRQFKLQADISAFEKSCEELITAEEHYLRTEKSGIEYGESFQAITQMKRGVGRSVSNISLPAKIKGCFGYTFHPVQFDACLQTVFAAIKSEKRSDAVFLPAALNGLRIFKTLPDEIICATRVKADDGKKSWESDEDIIASLKKNGKLSISVTIFDNEGGIVAKVDDFRLIKLKSNIAPKAKHDLYQKTWKVVSFAEKHKKSPQGNRYLAISCGDTLSQKYLSALRGFNQVTEVDIDARETKSATEMGEFLAQHSSESGPFNGIIYGGSCHQTDLTMDEIDHQKYLRIPLVLTQALLKREWKGLDVTFLSSSCQSVDNEEINNPIAALTWGHVFCFVNENNRYCRLIDLDDTVEISADSLQKIITNKNQCQFVMRKQSVFSPVVKKYISERKNNVKILEEGSYLITGGFGGLGLKSALALEKSGAKNIILLGRNIKTGNESQEIAELTKKGVKIYAVSADISDYSQLENSLDRALQDTPPLRGIIHAAGVLEDGIIMTQTWDKYLKVLGAKVNGIVNLVKYVQAKQSDKRLDFVVNYSSIASVLGNPGQANYSAANSFLDSLSYYLSTRGIPSLSINWGPWQEIGMAAEQLKNVKPEQMLFDFIDTSRGVAFIAEQHSLDANNVIVLPLKLSEALMDHMPVYIRSLLDNILERGREDKHKDEVQASSTRPDLANIRISKAQLGKQGSPQRTRALSRYIATVSKALIQSDEYIAVNTSLFDLGFDSLSALSLKEKIEKDLGCQLHSTFLFDFPNIQSLVEHISVVLFVPENEEEEIDDLVEKMRIKLANLKEKDHA